jgi:hypothetical protein
MGFMEVRTMTLEQPGQRPPQHRPQTIHEAVAQATAQGWRVESLTPTTATMVSGTEEKAVDTNFHLINILVTLFTCGVWLPGYLIIWLVLNRKGTLRRMFLTQEEDGVSFTLGP